MVKPSIARARKLRRAANYPDRKAWETLRTLRRQGLAVRRQVPIAGLIVDFAIRSKRLVIEIDGSIHDLEEVQFNDAVRDARLRAAGWRVVRIRAEIALSPDHLIKAVLEALRHLLPHAPPSPECGRRAGDEGKMSSIPSPQSLSRIRVGKNADIQTVTPGAGDKLLVMNGDLGKTLGQFKSFAMASNQRVMIRGAQQARMGDARFISGITTFVALGMVVYALKSYLSNRSKSDDPVTWAREGVDRSGVLPVFMEAFNTGEKVSGQTFLGESPTSRYASRGKIDSMLGPSFGRMQNASDVISNSLDGELKDRDLHAVRKLLPFNNIFYLRKFLDEFEIQAVEAEETTLSDKRESMFTN